MASSSATPSPSGIVTSSPSSSLDGDGTRIIPSSRRPDGTYRKERKVRAGYVPPEDVARYTNVRLASTRPTAAQLQQQKEKEEAERRATLSKAQKKNERRKVKRKEDQQQQHESPASPGTSASTTTTTTTATAEAEAATKEQRVSDPVEATTSSLVADKTTGAVTAPQPPQDPAKLLRALNKKLSQAQTLKTRQDKGETLLPEQAEKVAKMDDLQAQIAALQLS